MRRIKDLIFTALVFAFAIAAQAVPTVIYSIDGGNTWVVPVNDRVGSWRVTASAFSTVGVEGQLPEIGFTSFEATSRLPGTLMVRLYDTGFDWAEENGYFLSEIEGLVSGGSRVSVKTYVDPDNGGFGTKAFSADLLTSQGNFFAGSLTDLTINSTYGIPSETFSMMFEATITQRIGGGRVSFSSSLIDPPTSVPDGGSTLVLIGLSFVALSLYKQRTLRSRV